RRAAAARPCARGALAWGLAPVNVPSASIASVSRQAMAAAPTEVAAGEGPRLPAAGRRPVVETAITPFHRPNCRLSLSDARRHRHPHARDCPPSGLSLSMATWSDVE